MHIGHIFNEMYPVLGTLHFSLTRPEIEANKIGCGETCHVVMGK